MGDHLHMLLMIPPKHSMAHTIGFLKGKSAIRILMRPSNPLAHPGYYGLLTCDTLLQTILRPAPKLLIEEVKQQ